MTEVYKIGKVFKVYGSENICPDCGDTTHNHTFLLWPDGENIFKVAKEIKRIGVSSTIRVAICECGNIFLRQRLLTTP